MVQTIPIKDLCVIYIHGFRSSPQSTKAIDISQWVRDLGGRFECPALDISPLNALDQITQVIDQVIDEGYRPRLIGSSLGGFYASWFMERHPQRGSFKAVLINPACWPSRDLVEQVGPVQAWHGPEILQFHRQYLDDLKSMEVGLTEPERYMLVAAKGDTLLDWNEMVARYPGSLHYIIEGSDHSLSDFPNHWPEVKKFLLC